MKLKLIQWLSYAVFVTSLFATLSSLFLSEVLKLTPCDLCWYQRIFMFPIVIISAVNIIKKHSDIHYYILPFSIIGFLLALYQNLLVWHVVADQIAPCASGVSCINQPIMLFGFLTIPLGSMITFAVLTILMLLYAQFVREKH